MVSHINKDGMLGYVQSIVAEPGEWSWSIFERWL